MGALDRIVWQIQQVLGRLLGTIRTPHGEVSDMVIPSAAARRGGFFMFQDTPEALPDAVAGLSSVPVSTFMEDPLLADDTEEFATLIGAVSTATANKLLVRDANGRAKVANPAALDDIATWGSVMPVGSIYIQLYNQATPASMWGGTWSNVSSTWAGLFFRAEGGAASAWGTASQAYQNKYHQHLHGYRVNNVLAGIALYGYLTQATVSGDAATTAGGTNYQPYTSWDGNSGDTEARPYNQTMRIWKRTA